MGITSPRKMNYLVLRLIRNRMGGIVIGIRSLLRKTLIFIIFRKSGFLNSAMMKKCRVPIEASSGIPNIIPGSWKEYRKGGISLNYWEIEARMEFRKGMMI